MKGEDSFAGTNPIAESIEKLIAAPTCVRFSKREYDEDYACNVPITPAWLIGSGVSMLRQWFGSDERITLGPSTFRWHEDPEKSRILISEDDSWDFETVGKRPAVIVDLGDVDHITKSPQSILGGQSGGGTLLGHIPETGEVVFASIDEAILAFRCFSKSRAEAWMLAWEVKTFIQTYSGPLQDAYNLMDFTVQGTSRPTRMPGYEGYLVSTVSVKTSVQDTWSLFKESLRVQAICSTIPTS